MMLCFCTFRFETSRPQCHIILQICFLSPRVVDGTVEVEDVNTPPVSSPGKTEGSQKSVLTRYSSPQAQPEQSPDKNVATSVEHVGAAVPSAAATAFEDEKLNSDLNGEEGAGPDEWNIEEGAEPPSGATYVNASLEPLSGLEEPAVGPKQPASEDNDGALDGAALMACEKKKKNLEQDRLLAAKAN
ncbi:hypothetical protein GN958_ATG13341 [Phytophthora infestans]|uniref:Uncharacterized protein n=1 Tax=Phytophthora infestans TaxID=4787 RepID=A0A8S9UDC5_PHYIN|nr:hypothetical protein GN958_ATG13341 [Phytophthora infestans]